MSPSMAPRWGFSGLLEYGNGPTSSRLRSQPNSPWRHHRVYSDAVSRTQVYLGEGELELLERASRDTGASRSELIRRAVRTTFGEQRADEKLRALKASAGSWKGRRISGAEYVDAIRGSDLNDRLARLGVK